MLHDRPLCSIVYYGELDELVRRLKLDKKVNLNERTPNSNKILSSGNNPTLLHLAAYFDHAEIFKILLEAGANPDLTAQQGSVVVTIDDLVLGKPELQEILKSHRIKAVAGATVSAAFDNAYSALAGLRAESAPAKEANIGRK
jgi:ankyrin repeat protein